ncbi:MAG: magnesium citrate secondary transporter [Bacteroidia bacterium]
MKVLLSPLFLLCLVVFLAEQLLEYSGLFIPFVHAYADDICALPVLLTIASAGMSLVYFGKRSTIYTYRLSFFQVVFALIYCIVLFEFVLPHYSAKYVADYWDLAAYFSGAVIYYLFINPKKYAPVI